MVVANIRDPAKSTGEPVVTSGTFLTIRANNIECCAHFTYVSRPPPLATIGGEHTP